MKPVLAINGAAPSITAPRPHYSWPIITDATREAVMRQLDESISIYDKSGVIERLESQLAGYYRRKHALLFNSGTCALLAMYFGLECREGDEIICPAYTFFATATPLFFTGAVPILVDCDAHGNIDPAQVERAISPRTKAIVATHMWGRPCDMAGLEYVSNRHGIPLLEDGSHSHGARYDGKKIGSFGLASAFSLQGQKTLTGGEGGVLLTDSDEIHFRALALGHYNKRCKTEIPADHPLRAFATTGFGLKFRIHPLAAAIVEEQLRSLDKTVASREAQALEMVEMLGAVPGFRPPELPGIISCSWYALIVRYDPALLNGVPIEKIYAALQAEGCSEVDRPGSTQPLNELALFGRPEALFPAYSGRINYRPGQFPNAEAFHTSILKLPVWHRAEDRDLARQYCEAFSKVAFNNRELLDPETPMRGTSR